MRAERALRPAGLFPMETSDKYREYAEECERLAKQAKTAHHRDILIEMAQAWRQLADEAKTGPPT